MIVRRLSPDEAGEVVRTTLLQDEAPDPRAAAAYLQDSRNVFLVAYEGSEAIGYLRGTELRQLKSAAKQMFLYEIAVDPKFRRKGAGRGLIEFLLGYCRDREFEEVFVFTDPGNTAAVGLYRSTGGVTETSADRMYVYPLGAGGPSGKRTPGVRP
jgi:ribosomal protein S18 acetylase RimI-like enzyme